MASRGEGPLKSDDFRHFCSLCMESYSSVRSPKMLSCFHTFCLPCLIALAEKAEQEGKDGADRQVSGEDDTKATTEDPLEEEEDDQRQDVSDMENEGSGAPKEKKDDEKSTDTLLCPTCRSSVIIPPGGLFALQTNFYVTLDMESNADPDGPSLCEMCEEGEKEEAQHFCHNCQQRMCRSCRRLHDRVTGARDHRVESLSEQAAPTLEVAMRGKKMCHFHPDQILCFHCCKCDVTICLHCKLTSHEGHDTQDMATAAVQAKGEMAGLHTRTNKQLQLLEACISRLERDELDLKRQKEEVLHHVSSRYDLLIGWATRARDEFLEEVAAKEQAKLSEIHMRKTSTSFFKGNISSKKMRASQTLSLGAELVLVKNELQASLLKEESLEDHQKLANRKEHLTFFRNMAEASVLDISTVRAYMGQLIDSPADGVEFPSLSFHEMALAVSRLETELQGVRDKFSTQKVMFHATMPSNTNVNASQKIVFNNVLSNEGSGYSNSTGIFTSPVDGAFMFTTTVRNATNGYGYQAALMVRGVDFGRVFHPESSTAHCVVTLKEGDQVWVQPYSNFTCMGSCCMFSGALISM